MKAGSVYTFNQTRLQLSFCRLQLVGQGQNTGHFPLGLSFLVTFTKRTKNRNL